MINEYEELYIDRLKKLCSDIPMYVNNDYSLINWTYTKLCIKDFSSSHNVWILGNRMKLVRSYVKGNESNSIMIGALMQVITFCLAWIYFLVDWDNLGDKS